MEIRNSTMNNRGSSLIMVVIGAAFLGILISLILSITYTNVDLKVADNQSKKNFYIDESIVNELTAKLEEYSADSMTTAYRWYIKNYQKESTTSKYDEFKKKYWIAFSQKLNNKVDENATDVEFNYKVSILQDAITSISKDVTNPEHVIFSVNKSSAGSTASPVPAASTTPVFEEGELEFSKGDDGNYDYNYMTIKNLCITYTDPVGYQSSIVTDINLEIPTSSGADPTFAKFALISDELVKCNSQVTVKGGVYGGTKNGIETDSGDLVTPNKGGIWVDGANNSMTIDGSGNLVATRANIMASNCSSLNITNAKVWAKNILTYGPGATEKPEIKINATTKVQDDLILKANNSTVTLQGSYYGYSYKDYDVDDKTSAGTSSAITINAKEVKLDMGSLKNFAVFGRAFVSSNIGTSSISSQLMDIMTGQSVAVKNDQSAYLIPVNSSILIPSNPIDIQSLNTYATAVYDKNKDKEERKEQFKNYDPSVAYLSLSMVKDIVDFSKGNAKTIYDNFLNAEQPIRAIYYQQGTGTAAQGMANYYYNFRNQTCANLFYEKYLDNPTSEAEAKDSYTQFYRTGGLKLPSSAERFQVAGDIFYKNSSGSYSVKKGEIDDVTKESEYNEDTYKSVQLHLRENGSSEEKLDENPYVDKHFGVGNINKDFTDTISIGNETTSIKTSISGVRDVKVRIFGKSDDPVEITDNMDGLIIAAGDVKVTATQFEGLIVADGTIELANPCNFYANEKLIVDILNYCHDNGELLENYVYGYGSSEKLSVGNDSVDFGAAISFENWRKNV